MPRKKENVINLEEPLDKAIGIKDGVFDKKKIKKLLVKYDAVTPCCLSDMNEHDVFINVSCPGLPTFFIVHRVNVNKEQRLKEIHFTSSLGQQFRRVGITDMCPKLSKQIGQFRKLTVLAGQDVTKGWLEALQIWLKKEGLTSKEVTDVPEA